MARVNVTIPDDLIAAARERGLNVSAVASAALVAELDRRRKRDRLRAELDELDRELGPVPEAERAAAASWVEDLRGGPVRTSA